MIREYTVPGNILLAGEYAITREGGLGIALAPARFLKIRTIPGERFSLEGSAFGKKIDGSGLAGAVLTAAREILSVSASDPRFSVRVVADSTELFATREKKLGLGSSAALAVGLASVCVDCIHPPGRIALADKQDRVLRIALKGHRAFQGGGSGYDVYTSFFGGTGLFTGGEKPGWKPLEGADWMEITLISAEEHVRSGPAVRSFKKLLAQRPGDLARFVECSNRAVLRLEAALARCAGSPGALMENAHLQPESQDPGDGLYRALLGARRVGLWIGRSLGLDPEGGMLADVLAGLRSHRIPAKASGAGGELAIAFGFPPAYFSSELSLFNVKIARDGVQWR